MVIASIPLEMAYFRPPEPRPIVVLHRSTSLGASNGRMFLSTGVVLRRVIGFVCDYVSWMGHVSVSAQYIALRQAPHSKPSRARHSRLKRGPGCPG